MLQEGKLYIVKAIDHGCPPNAASASPEVGRAHFYIAGFESSSQTTVLLTVALEFFL